MDTYLWISFAISACSSFGILWLGIQHHRKLQAAAEATIHSSPSVAPEPLQVEVRPTWTPGMAPWPDFVDERLLALFAKQGIVQEIDLAKLQGNFSAELWKRLEKSPPLREVWVASVASALEASEQKG